MNLKLRTSVLVPLIALVGLSGCAEVSVPDARNVKIPSPMTAEERKEAINERPDSVMYLPLGTDVLVPERIAGDQLPNEIAGPFELRSETLAGALQLILADYDISIAFETDQGLTRKVTVANLKGSLDKVVNTVCSLADLYCSYEDGGLVIKDRQTFAVTLPPLANAEGGDEYIADVIQGLGAVLGTGSVPVSDPTTRTIIYTATQRTSQLAENYFQRLRANTAMIVFETYIWEVSLNSGNTAGIDWGKIESFGKFSASIAFNGTPSADFTNPVSIGLPTTQTGSPTEFVQFLSQFGAVKTISQPQITVLSGSNAELRVADTQNYVSEVTSTISGDNTTTSVSTDSVDSGFTLTIGSSWDKSTVYANVDINLANVDAIEDFAFDTDSGGGQTTIQLPQTTERELSTQIRVRPGDSVLIAGLVREVDNFNSRGPGFMEPIIPDSRTAKTDNLELVVLLRPRVIVYTDSDDPRYTKFINDKNALNASLRAKEEWLKADAAPKIEAPESPAALVEVVKEGPVVILPKSEPVLEKKLAPAPKAEPLALVQPVTPKLVIDPVVKAESPPEIIAPEVAKIVEEVPEVKLVVQPEVVPEGKAAIKKAVDAPSSVVAPTVVESKAEVLNSSKFIGSDSAYTRGAPKLEAMPKAGEVSKAPTLKSVAPVAKTVEPKTKLQTVAPLKEEIKAVDEKAVPNAPSVEDYSLERIYTVDDLSDQNDAIKTFNEKYVPEGNSTNGTNPF